ncbi:MAG TPA: Flp pilus assembly protein CpaB [Bdellovibrionales bacterium]|nr:Flp pilus assembly protein CpaB [Bdellovibrionales bacterium]
MNHNETRTLWISVGAALFAVFLLYSYTQEKSAALQKKFGAKQRVVIAAADIAEMETVDETKMQIEERPVDFIEPSAFSNPEDAVGMITLAPIKKGEQILQSKVIKPGPVTGLSLQVSPSKRAVALPVTETNAAAKLFKPGDRIDIVAAMDVGKGIAQHREVKTLMQDVVVLSTGLIVMNELPALLERQGKDEYVRSLRSDLGFSTITVEASPEEAQDLIYILSTSPGSLFMTLRHPSDHTKKRMPEATIESLLGKVSQEMMNLQQRAPAAAPPPPPVPIPAPKPKKKSPFVPL